MRVSLRPCRRQYEYLLPLLCLLRGVQLRAAYAREGIAFSRLQDYIQAGTVQVEDLFFSLLSLF
jgi:hypothetical protein